MAGAYRPETKGIMKFLHLSCVSFVNYRVTRHVQDCKRHDDSRARSWCVARVKTGLWGLELSIRFCGRRRRGVSHRLISIASKCVLVEAITVRLFVTRRDSGVMHSEGERPSKTCQFRVTAWTAMVRGGDVDDLLHVEFM